MLNTRFYRALPMAVLAAALTLVFSMTATADHHGGSKSAHAYASEFTSDRAKLVKQADINYPAQSMTSGIGGYVDFNFDISKKGRVNTILIGEYKLQSKGDPKPYPANFIRAGFASLSQWKFEIAENAKGKRKALEDQKIRFHFVAAK